MSIATPEPGATLRRVNLILLEAGDFATEGRVRLGGRRLVHARDVLRARPGDELRVGAVGGKLGVGRVVRLDAEVLELEVALDRPPPQPAPAALVLALPRPPVLRRVLRSVSAMGVKRIVLIHTRRVEKSFWQSPALRPEALRHQLLLGLEQAGDTIPPRVELARRFRPFVEDDLPGLLAAGRGLVAHPAARAPCPRDPGEPVTLVVGPEGGLVDFELERLEAQGVAPVTLGARPLQVETAVVALLARLLP